MLAITKNHGSKKYEQLEGDKSWQVTATFRSTAKAERHSEHTACTEGSLRSVTSRGSLIRLGASLLVGATCSWSLDSLGDV